MRISMERMGWPFLFLMTAFTILGPLLLHQVLGEGERDTFPPEGPWEWWVSAGVIGGGVVVYVSCLVLAFTLPKK